MTPESVLALLESIDRGEVTVTPTHPPDEVYAGNVHYTTSNGFDLAVFNDCGEWDYLDSATAPDGTHVEFWGAEPVPADDEWEPVRRYQPPHDCRIRPIWGITIGYIAYEGCVNCDAEAKPRAAAMLTTREARLAIIRRKAELGYVDGHAAWREALAKAAEVTGE